MTPCARAADERIRRFAGELLGIVQRTNDLGGDMFLWTDFARIREIAQELTRLEPRSPGHRCRVDLLLDLTTETAIRAVAWLVPQDHGRGITRPAKSSNGTGPSGCPFFDKSRIGARQ